MSGPDDDAPPGARPGPGPAELSDRFLDGARVARVSLRDAVLEQSTLTGARLDDVAAERLHVTDCRLAGAVFEDVSLAGATFRDVDLRDVAISDARLDGMTIDGIAVTDLLARWRDG